MGIEKICKWCKNFQPNESYCTLKKETKSGKSSCNSFEVTKFLESRKPTQKYYKYINGKMW